MATQCHPSIPPGTLPTITDGGERSARGGEQVVVDAGEMFDLILAAVDGSFTLLGIDPASGAAAPGIVDQ